MKIDLKQLEFIDSRLRKMAYDAEAELGKEGVITSLYRINDKGVHGTLPLRGLDLRCHDDKIGPDVAKRINQAWKYDPNRPDKVCCMYHDIGQGAHIHLQVHPNTVRVNL